MIGILEDKEERIIQFRKKFPNAFITNNPHEFVKFVLENQDQIKLISLDHDLEWFEEVPYKIEVTGTEVAKALVASNLRIDMNIVIHSWNAVGGPRMKQIFQDQGYLNVEFRPWRGV